MQKDICKIPKEKKKAEAIKRMEDMGFGKDLIHAYEISSVNDFVTIDQCDSRNSFEHRETLDKAIANLENNLDSLVYAVIRSRTEFGIIDNLLFVSDEKRFWKAERFAGNKHTPIGFTVNYNHPECSAITSIPISINETGIPSLL